MLEGNGCDGGEGAEGGVLEGKGRARGKRKGGGLEESELEVRSWIRASR